MLHPVSCLLHTSSVSVVRERRDWLPLGSSWGNPWGAGWYHGDHPEVNFQHVPIREAAQKSRKGSRLRLGSEEPWTWILCYNVSGVRLALSAAASLTESRCNSGAASRGRKLKRCPALKAQGSPWLVLTYNCPVFPLCETGFSNHPQRDRKWRRSH